jgi:hypothetical protein
LNENSISLLTSSSEKNNYWYRDDTPLGETSSQLSISEPGVYKLKVSVDGCDSEFDTVEIIITAIGDKTGVISLYPNPTSETVNVRVPFVTPTSYQIHDANGRLIDARSSSNRDEQFDVSLYPKGTYILTIRNGSVSKSHLVVKK